MTNHFSLAKYVSIRIRLLPTFSAFVTSAKRERLVPGTLMFVCLLSAIDVTLLSHLGIIDIPVGLAACY